MGRVQASSRNHHNTLNKQKVNQRTPNGFLQDTGCAQQEGPQAGRVNDTPILKSVLAHLFNKLHTLTSSHTSVKIHNREWLFYSCSLFQFYVFICMPFIGTQRGDTYFTLRVPGYESVNLSKANHWLRNGSRTASPAQRNGALFPGSFFRSA